MSFLHRTLLAGAAAIAFAAPAAAAQVCYFGECAPATTAPATTAATPTRTIPKAQPDTGFKVLVQYGSWQVISKDGQRVVLDTFDDGSFIMIGVKDGSFAMVFHNPQWSLTKGQTFEVRADIDGRVFKGTAKAIDDNLVSIEDITMDFMKVLCAGEKATITVVGEDWNLYLVNAAKAIEAAGTLKTVAGE